MKFSITSKVKYVTAEMVVERLKQKADALPESAKSPFSTDSFIEACNEIANEKGADLIFQVMPALIDGTTENCFCAEFKKLRF